MYSVPIKGRPGKCRLICMAFDGEFKQEGSYETIEQAWDRAAEMGSRWYFYPWHFVISCKANNVNNYILDTPEGLEHFKRHKVKTIQNVFRTLSEKPEMQDVDAETFNVALEGIEL